MPKTQYRLALLAAFACLAPLAAPAQQNPVPWLAPVHNPGDVQLVDGYDPKDADTPAVKDTIARLRETGRSARAGDEVTRRILAMAREFRSPDLPVIAQERLVAEAVNELAARGTAEAIDQLRVWAKEEPKALYLAPGCREPHRHLFFDYASTARLAIAAIEERTAESLEKVRPDSGETPSEALARWRNASQSAAALRGSLRGWLDRGASTPNADEELSTAVADALAAGSLNDAESLAIADTARDAAMPRTMEAILLNAQPSAAQRAVAGAIRIPEFDAAKRIDLAARRPEIGSLLLGSLDASTASSSTFDAVARMLASEPLGADAALALLRIDGERAIAHVATRLAANDAGIVEKRRCVLLLMQSPDPRAREALKAFVGATTTNPDEQQLKERARQCISGN